MNVAQGDIWWLTPSPHARGSEQKGRRPALVLQNDIANKYLNTTVVALISSSGTNALPEMVEVGEREGLMKTSFADFTQLFTVDRSRLSQKVGSLSSLRWSEVEAALMRVFVKTIG